MSVLATQWRYAHISGLRGDGVNPELLGMRKVMSEDSARRAFKQGLAGGNLSMAEAASAADLRAHAGAGLGAGSGQHGEAAVRPARVGS